MNTEAARQFCHGAFLAQRCQRHLRLELCRMLLPDLRHPVTPSPAAILGAGVSLSHLSSFRGPAHTPIQHKAHTAVASGIRNDLNVANSWLHGFVPIRARSAPQLLRFRLV